MATRVLATDEARSTIAQMQSVLSGGLADQIRQLDQEGKTLSDPNVWDGPLAIEFRNTVWPECNASLQNALTALQDLQSRLQTINQNIMAAGGGS